MELDRIPMEQSQQIAWEEQLEGMNSGNAAVGEDECFAAGWMAALRYASYHPRIDWTQTITGAGFSKPRH